MIFYGYDKFEKDIKIMAREVAEKFAPDAIIGVARGGLTLAHFMATALNNRNCFALNSIHYDEQNKLDTIDIFNIPDLSQFKKVLICDDIVDSGESIDAIKKELKAKFPNLELAVAAIFYKKGCKVMPEFWADEAFEWVEYFWDVRL